MFPKHHPGPIDPKDLNGNNNLILLPTKEDIASLFNLFAPMGDNIELVLFNALHSPIKYKDGMYSIVKDWYTSNPDNNMQIIIFINMKLQNPTHGFLFS